MTQFDWFIRFWIQKNKKVEVKIKVKIFSNFFIFPTFLVQTSAMFTIFLRIRNWWLLENYFPISFLVVSFFIFAISIPYFIQKPKSCGFIFTRVALMWWKIILIINKIDYFDISIILLIIIEIVSKQWRNFLNRMTRITNHP